MQFISIDIGSLSTKGSLVSETGEVLCDAAILHSIQNPHPDWAEQDGEEIWWKETCEVLRRLLGDPLADRNSIAGVGVSGLFPAVLLADKNGKPLRPALLYSDNRAARELEALNDHFNLHLTGDAVPSKLVWLRDNEPEVFTKAQYVFSSHNYIVYQLTGTYCLDFKVADSFGGLLDRQTMQWRQDVADWAGWDVRYLPELRSEIGIAGEVTPQAASETGLRPGTPVITGSGDSPCTLVSAGVIERGDALLSFGTSGWMGVVPRRVTDYYRKPSLLLEGSPYMLKAYLLTLGAALQWFRDEFVTSAHAIAERPRISAYELMDTEASLISPGSDGIIILPYFMGGRPEQFNLPNRATISGLTLSHSRSHVYRALLESFGYVVRSELDELACQGIPVNRIVGTGGGAASGLWRQIISDIIGQPVYYHREADPRLGTAYLTGYALGLWDSLDGIRTWLSPAVVSEPSKNTRTVYEDSYQRFLILQTALSR